MKGGASIFRDLYEAIGPEALLRLIEAHAGIRTYIPKDATILAGLVGESAAALLAERYGGDYLKVPLARAWRAAIYRSSGAAVPEIARKLGLTESGARELLKKRVSGAYRFYEGQPLIASERKA